MEPINVKAAINLFADILYAKGLLCFEEMDALLDISNQQDVYNFSERMIRGDFNVYKRGEVYTESISTP